jgi:hypothetical protein
MRCPIPDSCQFVMSTTHTMGWTHPPALDFVHIMMEAIIMMMLSHLDPHDGTGRRRACGPVDSTTGASWVCCLAQRRTRRCRGLSCPSSPCSHARCPAEPTTPSWSQRAETCACRLLSAAAASAQLKLEAVCAVATRLSVLVPTTADGRGAEVTVGSWVMATAAAATSLSW